MEQITIQPDDPLLWTYYAELRQLRRQGVYHEGATRRAFSNLLQGVGRKKDWVLIEELPSHSRRGSGSIRPDGTLRDKWQLPHGWWEAKDVSDDLDSEIENKITRGYPLENTIFENTEIAFLYQNKHRTFSASLQNPEELADLLTRFINFEFKPFEDFKEAIARYGREIPNIAAMLNNKINKAHAENTDFILRYVDFLEVCKTSLNPKISRDTVDEMLVQHLMTERIIRRVFGVDDFVSRNVIASEIERVIAALTSEHFNRKEFLGSLDPFFHAIEEAANHLQDFYDKQEFITTVYERFFQDYSVEDADTHGIVYTPRAIVDFMCAATEEALETEFGAKLGDKSVFIIDPATGTGNFVANLLERAHDRNIREFEEFYSERLFANEVLLMPYYIASLSIEYKYFDLMRKYRQFPGLCFVDTLDTVVTASDTAGKRQSSFLFSEGNTKRVANQVRAPINVIIGNPPYNVGQENENDNNKNRSYPRLDARIRRTYSEDSRAQLKAKITDAYVRFWRWASDRLDDRDGIVVYISNNSFVDAYSFDGMRKHLLKDFTRIYHLDLGGNIRKKTNDASIGNVFGIQVGVGITIAIRSENHKDNELYYCAVPNHWSGQEKLEFLDDASSRSILSPPTPTKLWDFQFKWKRIRPDRNNTWLVSYTDLEFSSYMPLGIKSKGKSKLTATSKAVFHTYSLGVSTNRDWQVYDYESGPLKERIRKFVSDYNSEIDRYSTQYPVPADIDDFVDYQKLDWSSTLKGHLKRKRRAKYNPDFIRTCMYRPFAKKILYYVKPLIDRPGKHTRFLPSDKSEAENIILEVSAVGGGKPFHALVTNVLPDLHLTGDSQCFPYYTYDEDGSNRTENITDYALDQFRSCYNDTRISKWDIFYYVYGLLHHPGYRERYALDLKRNLPRIPFAPVATKSP